MKTVATAKLSQEGCDIIVNAAIEKAKELKQIGSICVVDAGAHLMAFKRMTNGRTHNTLSESALGRVNYRGHRQDRARRQRNPRSPGVGANPRRGPWIFYQYRRRLADHRRRTVHRRRRL